MYVATNFFAHYKVSGVAKTLVDIVARDMSIGLARPLFSLRLACLADVAES